MKRNKDSLSQISLFKYYQNKKRKEDTIVLYGFQMCVENDTQSIEDVVELEEIILGATDEIIDNFNRLSNEQKNICVIRINSLLETYNHERGK